ncbi:MAG: hypothetical protein LBK94_03545 [Prevotellaceae bacterium]|nr:hypothetical protein [Prevotellaceae bacterium]
MTKEEFVQNVAQKNGNEMGTLMVSTVLLIILRKCGKDLNAVIVDILGVYLFNNLITMSKISSYTPTLKLKKIMNNNILYNK